MRTFLCKCGADLFFHNSLCLACGRECGFCPHCRRVTALLSAEEVDAPGPFRCGHDDCGASIAKCRNYVDHAVCNWCVAAGDPEVGALCESCQLTTLIPDLSIAGNQQRWAELEKAKRRLLYTLQLLGLPYKGREVRVPLQFHFKGDPVDPSSWRPIGSGHQVFTGHAAGTITINIREADSVEREKERVLFNESQRTLIGHFRHEMGHYYWEVLVRERRETEFAAIFGDYREPTYQAAKDAYYANGPAPDWAARFVSPYASMHPWEDFAETFNTYLNMIALLDTAGHTGLLRPLDLGAALDQLVNDYRMLGIAANELNREMGLLDAVADTISAPVVEKLSFIHRLARTEATASAPAPDGRRRAS